MLACEMCHDLCVRCLSTCVVRCVHDVTIVFRCSLMAANVTRARAIPAKVHSLR